MNHSSLTPLTQTINSSPNNRLANARQPINQQATTQWKHLLAERSTTETAECETNINNELSSIRGKLGEIEEHLKNIESTVTQAINPDLLPSAFKGAILDRNNYPAEAEFKAIFDLMEGRNQEGKLEGGRKLGEASQATIELTNRSDNDDIKSKAEAIKTAIDAAVEAMYQSIWIAYSENAEKDFAIALSKLADTQTEGHSRNINFKPSDSADWVMNREIISFEGGEVPPLKTIEEITQLREDGALGKAWVEAKRLYDSNNEATRQAAHAIVEGVNGDVNTWYDDIWTKRQKKDENEAKRLNGIAYENTKGYNNTVAHPRHYNFDVNDSRSVMKRDLPK